MKLKVLQYSVSLYIRYTLDDYFMCNNFLLGKLSISIIMWMKALITFSVVSGVKAYPRYQE